MADEGKEPKPQYGIVNFERRRSPRFSVDLPIEYSRIEDSEKNPARTCNASEGGLMLLLGQKLEVGQSLKIKIFFHSEPRLHSLEVKGKVAWTEIPFPREGDYRCGVQFTQIAPEDLAQLRQFLDHLSTIQPLRRIVPRSQGDSHS
jgi:c-di-GMP-binding flagellar brake protein YcgR